MEKIHAMHHCVMLTECACNQQSIQKSRSPLEEDRRGLIKQLRTRTWQDCCKECKESDYCKYLIWHLHGNDLANVCLLYSTSMPFDLYPEKTAVTISIRPDCQKVPSNLLLNIIIHGQDTCYASLCYAYRMCL